MNPSPKRIRTATKEYATMPFPVFDLHCDTADRIAWTSLDKHYHQLAGLDRFDPNIDGGEPDTELKTNGCHLSLDSMGDVPWAQCFACFIYDEFSPEDSVGFYRQVMAHLADELKRNASLVASAQNASDIRPGLPLRQSKRSQIPALKHRSEEHLLLAVRTKSPERITG